MLPHGKKTKVSKKEKKQQELLKKLELVPCSDNSSDYSNSLLSPTQPARAQSPAAVPASLHLPDEASPVDSRIQGLLQMPSHLSHHSLPFLPCQPPRQPSSQPAS